eukprot:11562808-Ditylum_brightwellii.AAC.1
MMRTSKNASEFISVFNPEDLRFTPITYPPDCNENATRIAFEKWKNRYNQAEDLVVKRKVNINKAFGVVLRQCLCNVRDILDSKKDIFGPIKANLDVISLLTLIQDSLYTGAATKKPKVSKQKALSRLFRFKQGPAMSDSKFLERFSELVEVLKHMGTRLGEEDSKIVPTLNAIAYDPLNPTDTEITQARSIASK